MTWTMSIFLLLQATAGQPSERAQSEVMKTVTADVVISEMRYRGADRLYPAPPFWRRRGPPPRPPIGTQLCNAAKERFPDTAAPSGWQVESMILKASGATATEPLESQRAKIARWWKSTDLTCDLLGRSEGNFLPMFIEPDIAGYRIVDKIILKYALPLNDIQPKDGRTLLDYIADSIDEQIARGPSSRIFGLTRIYGTLRRFGARHRKELEQQGLVPTPAALMLQNISAWQAAANKGDADAGLQLVEVYARGRHHPQDVQLAAKWLEIAEANAIKSRSGYVLGILGDAYSDVFRDERGPAMPPPAAPPYAGKRDRAARVLEAAMNADFPGDDSNFWKNSAQFDLGYVYYMGIGTPKNPQRALHILAPLTGDASAQIWTAEILLAQGERERALRHLRNVAFSSQGNSSFMGTTVSEWLKRQPEGICGLDSSGERRC